MRDGFLCNVLFSSTLVLFNIRNWVTLSTTLRLMTKYSTWTLLISSVRLKKSTASNVARFLMSANNEILGRDTVIYAASGARGTSGRKSAFRGVKCYRRNCAYRRQSVSYYHLYWPAHFAISLSRNPYQREKRNFAQSSNWNTALPILSLILTC